MVASFGKVRYRSVVHRRTHARSTLRRLLPFGHWRCLEAILEPATNQFLIDLADLVILIIYKIILHRMDDILNDAQKIQDVANFRLYRLFVFAVDRRCAFFPVGRGEA